jgi:hypothetical protein
MDSIVIFAGFYCQPEEKAAASEMNLNILTFVALSFILIEYLIFKNIKKPLSRLLLSIVSVVAAFIIAAGLSLVFVPWGC